MLHHFLIDEMYNNKKQIIYTIIYYAIYLVQSRQNNSESNNKNGNNVNDGHLYCFHVSVTFSECTLPIAWDGGRDVLGECDMIYRIPC